MPVYKAVNKKFFDTWSPHMAYILGYFAADGSMIKNRRGAHFVEFTSTDRILLTNLKRAVNSNHKITQRKRDNEKHKMLYRLQIGSRNWFRALERLGFTQHKSNTLHFPKVPKHYIGHFVRGYFDGDGCVYLNKLRYADRTRKRWVLLTIFTSGSRKFLLSLWSLLKHEGVIGGSLKKKNRGFELVFSHHDSLALRCLMYDTSFISGLFLPRKREKLERAVKVLHLD
jgi:intein-encoded DNA endonuclease-like protein